MSIRWDNGPPRALPPADLEVWHCPPGGNSFVRFLGPPIATWLHWIEPPPATRDARKKGKTAPCTEKGCVHCAAGDRGQRTSYAPALVWHRVDPDASTEMRWKRIVCQLSECAEADILEAMGEYGWRNLTVALSRHGRKNQRISAKIAAKQFDDLIPEAFDVVPTLERLWTLVPKRSPATEPPNDDAPVIIPMRRDAQ